MSGFPDIAGWVESAGGPLTPGQALRFMRTSFGLDLDRVARCAGVVPDLLRAVETDQATMPPAWLGAVAEAIMQLHESTNGLDKG